MSTERQYTTKDVARFYSKVSTTPTEQGCLEWLAYRWKGYGYFGVGGKSVGAYRVAWEIVNGPIPAGMVIRHMCNNRLCCNPAHLETGSQADNVQDMMSSGRWMNAPNTITPYVRPVMPPKEEQFYAQVGKTPTDTGCLEWLGSRNPNGYGVFSHRGKRCLAHRVAWELVNGPIPAGLVIRHFVCDNPRCCRIEHLRIGTVADNNRDMVNKGRQSTAKGERGGGAKLTEQDVIAIRSDLYIGWTHRAIAQHFGIDQTQVSNILLRKQWAHLDATRDASRESGPAKGERHPNAKLTEQDVIAIRSDLYIGWTHRAIAERFGISRTYVSEILRRKSWAHV